MDGMFATTKFGSRELGSQLTCPNGFTRNSKLSVACDGPVMCLDTLLVGDYEEPYFPLGVGGISVCSGPVIILLELQLVARHHQVGVNVLVSQPLCVGGSLPVWQNEVVENRARSVLCRGDSPPYRFVHLGVFILRVTVTASVPRRAVSVPRGPKYLVPLKSRRVRLERWVSVER